MISNLPDVNYKILDPRIGDTIKHPTYATDGSAGLDLRACVRDVLTVNPGESHLIPTGIAIHINNPDYAALLLPRSGLGHKQGLVLGNLVGLIDSDYQGQVFVSLWNRGEHTRTIVAGDKIVQMVFVPVQRPTLKLVEEFPKPTHRGKGGFNSTGTQ